MRYENFDCTLVLGPLRGHKDGVNCTIFSLNGKYTVLASDDRTVHIWDLHTSNMVLTLGVHNDRVNSANFSLNRQLIISASWDGSRPGSKSARRAAKSEVSKGGQNSACHGTRRVGSLQ